MVKYWEVSGLHSYVIEARISTRHYEVCAKTCIEDRKGILQVGITLDDAHHGRA